MALQLAGSGTPLADQKTQSTYPRDDIDPKLKTIEWGLTYVKAAYYDFTYFVPRTCFYNSADKYEELRLYATGGVPINKFKRMFGVDEQANESWLNIDWTPPHAIGTIRDIAISRLCQQEYDVVATPVDPEAKSDLDNLYAGMRAKIAVRQTLQHVNPDLASHPMVQPEQNEPLDMEEMQMRVEFGEQFNRSKDAEQAIKLGMYENGEVQLRRGWYQDKFDIGVTGYFEELGEDNKPKARKVNPECVIANYCRWPDFRDLHHAGEVEDWDIVTLAQVKNDDGTLRFTDNELEQLANDVAGRWGNPMILGRSSYYFKGQDRFKVKVLRFRWYSYNDYAWEKGKDKRGNIKFPRAKYGEIGKRDGVVSKRVEVVYEIKWILGTDYAFDYRMVADMPRDPNPKKTTRTALGYRFFAWNFYEMRAKGMMERLMPLIDQYLMNWYRIQNLKNRMVPSGWWVDLDALENAALSKGGKVLTTLELLDFFFQTGIMVGRTKDIMGENQNYKPIIPISNSMFEDLTAIFNDMGSQLALMKQTVGLNDITDASTPNPKTLVPGYENANQGTNNALYQMQMGERWLYEHLANDILIRTQQGLKKGDISGYAPALASGTLQFLKVSPQLGTRPYGIMLQEKSTDDQRQALMAQMQPDLANGLLDSGDVAYVLNTYNLKQAQQLLWYKVKKNKEQQDQQKQALLAQQNQGNQQAGMATKQMEMQMEMIKHKNKMEEIALTGEWNYKIMGVRIGSQEKVQMAAQDIDMIQHMTPSADAQLQAQQSQAQDQDPGQSQPAEQQQPAPAA